MLDTVGRLLTRNFINYPILVIGAGRSGTSILLQALGEHAAIVSADRESPFIPYIGYLAHPFELRENKDYHISSLNLTLDYAYDQFRRICFEAVFGRDYGLRTLGSNLGQIRSTQQVKRWCAKTYPNEAECQSLIRLFPDIKLIYIFRNGVDVVHSRSRFKGMSKNSFEENCQNWAYHVEKYDYLKDMEQAIQLRQEDVARDPDSVFKRVQEFIGLPFHEGPAQFAKSTLIHSLDKKTQQDVDVEQVFRDREPPYTSWTGEQRDIFKEICGEGMHKLAYPIPF